MQKLISVKIKKNDEEIKITKKDLIARECYAGLDLASINNNTKTTMSVVLGNGFEIATSEIENEQRNIEKIEIEFDNLKNE